MSEETRNQVVEIDTNIEHTPLEYIYVTIPAEYICVYHRILIMLADYGKDMLKDCKATCKDRNSGVIECFNMFNSAVAARKLGDIKLADLLIKFIKTKINQIYKGSDNSTSFVFPVDENGELKAFVSCGERPKFWINAEDGELYEHKFGNGFDEHFRLGEEDGIYSTEEAVEDDDSLSNTYIHNIVSVPNRLSANINPRYESINGEYRPCADIKVYYDGRLISVNNTSYQYYFDDIPVIRFNDVINITEGLHVFECLIKYKGETVIASESLYYENKNN